jgi:anti-sigma B factor antagonist
MAEPATQPPSEARPPRPGGGALGVEIAQPRPDRALLTVRGELDTLTAPELDAALRELVSGSSGGLVVDLSGVTFLASSGLAVLIQAAQRAEDSGRRLHLVVASRAVLRPLEVTGSDQLFTLHRDLDAALAD